MVSQRQAEKEYLEQYYAKEGNQIVVVYGGHGIGKTTLVQEFAADKPMFYHLAGNGSERQQRYDWGKELSEEGMSLPEYPSFSQIWKEMLRVRSRKKVIILDEFQNLVKNSDTLMGELVSLVKDAWSNQEVLVLLCSSAVGWVENAMVRKIGKAAFELSGLIKLKDLPFSVLRAAYPDYPIEECIEIYAVLGGIPAYWSCFSKDLSMKENIRRSILMSSGALHYEAQRLVGEELRELAVYNTILSALAEGKHKLNDLYRHTEFSRAKISVYLKNLMELELVEKVFSYDTEGRDNTQKGIYRIKHRFVEFYYTYLYPHLSKLKVMGAEDFYALYVEQDLRRFANRCFREVCMEALDNGTYRRKGEWLGKTGNLDIVAEDNTGAITIGLCSFDAEVSIEDYEWFLFCASKAKLVPDKIHVFSGAGFDERLQKEADKEKDGRLTLHGLAELRFAAVPGIEG